MRSVPVFIALAIISLVLSTLSAPTQSDSPGIALVIHGGAGTIQKENMTPEKEKAYRGAMEEALQAGYAILSEGGSALDAVEATINVMEDSPLFNAGRGAVFTNQGRNEMDASIMDGNSHNAGAVASVMYVKHPISAARKVMSESKHVMLVGTGAMAFAREQGLEFGDSAYFFTQDRWNSLQKAREKESQQGALPGNGDKFGTVGAVAMDSHGDIAAATSTGGLTNKRWGRVGDSPIIGAGTYADNATCGVSCSGVGEYFIRGVLAYDLSAQMRYAGATLADAARNVIQDKLTAAAGPNTGGLIALDHDGHIVAEFNTPGMYRAWIRGDGTPHTFLYRNEE